MMILGQARQGVALILVLAAVTVVLAALAAALSIQGDARLAAHLDRTERAALLARADADIVIRAWLTQHGAALVRDPEAVRAPVVLVDDTDTDQPADEAVQLRIQIWDALAGVPVGLAHRGAPLQQALPAPWDQLAIEPPPARRAGGRQSEDQEAGRGPITMLLESLSLPRRGVPRYPPGLALPDTETSAMLGASVAAAQDASAPPLALALAVFAEGRININTAPVGLLEAAADRLGRDLDLGAIVTARRAGEPATLPPQLPATGDSRRSAQERLRLVDRSDRWQARIDCRLGLQRWSWWAVYAGATGTTGDDATDAAAPAGNDVRRICWYAIPP